MKKYKDFIKESTVDGLKAVSAGAERFGFKTAELMFENKFEKVLKKYVKKFESKDGWGDQFSLAMDHKSRLEIDRKTKAYGHIQKFTMSNNDKSKPASVKGSFTFLPDFKNGKDEFRFLFATPHNNFIKRMKSSLAGKYYEERPITGSGFYFNNINILELAIKTFVQELKYIHQ